MVGEMTSWIGFDIRGRAFDHCSPAVLPGAFSVEVGDDHVDLTIRQPGQPERVVRKH